jgi:hypothetical protein
MRIDERLILELQRAAWRIMTRLLPRDEPEPRDDYPPPPEGLGGGESLVVRPSLIPGAGLGLFTTRRHGVYEVLCLYTGERLSRWQQLRSRNTQYFAETAAGVVCCRKYLNIKARYINHHFDPARRNLVLASYGDAGTVLGRCRFYVSTREIEPGEELYGDYGERYWLWHRYSSLPLERIATGVKPAFHD